MEENKGVVSETEDISKAYETYFNSKIDNKLDVVFKKNNTIALILKFIGILVIIGGVLVWSGITINYEAVNFFTLAIALLISFSIAFGFFVIAEIIQILHDVRFRLWMK